MDCKNCENCKEYSSLTKPRELKGVAIIYGYCFKKKVGLTNTGYPVYIPEGKCKDYKPMRGSKGMLKQQMTFADIPGVMP